MIEQLFAGRQIVGKRLSASNFRIKSASVMFLFAGFRRANLGANLGWMGDPAFNPQFVHQVQKPMHRSGGFDAHQHRAEAENKTPSRCCLVHQRQIRQLSRCRV